MVSNKNEDGGRKRPYKLKARARRREEVHRRITEATVDLHRTVGPARTTVSDIAKLAGVQRATVYNHFPTEEELLDACSSHWVAENPPPDPEAWAGVEDAGRRVEIALTAMYAYFASGEDMLEKVLRDASLIPALDETNRRKWWPFIEELVASLARGWEKSCLVDPAVLGLPGKRRSRTKSAGDRETAITATLRVALDFYTWQRLARSGLSNEEAARLAAQWVRASA